MPESTVACPHCQQSIRVMTEHAGQQVACPFCQNAMVVPQFEPTAAEPKPRKKPRSRPRLSKRKREVAPVVEQPALEEPVVDKAVDPRPVDSLGEAAAKNAPVLISRGATSPDANGHVANTPGDDLLPPRFEPMLPRMADIALSADGKAVASMSFQEPVKTIRVNGHERVLRRLSPEEKIVRRRQRNAVIFVAGMLFLGVAVAILVRR